ncbi:MAG: hypothetical protein ABW185_29255, partial [Sedimenticola sp.]
DKNASGQISVKTQVKDISNKCDASDVIVANVQKSVNQHQSLLNDIQKQVKQVDKRAPDANFTKLETCMKLFACEISGKIDRLCDVVMTSIEKQQHVCEEQSKHFEQLNTNRTHRVVTTNAENQPKPSTCSVNASNDQLTSDYIDLTCEDQARVHTEIITPDPKLFTLVLRDDQGVRYERPPAARTTDNPPSQNDVATDVQVTYDHVLPPSFNIPENKSTINSANLIECDIQTESLTDNIDQQNNMSASNESLDSGSMLYARALQKVSRRSAGENGEQREKRQPQRQHEQRLTNNSNVIPQAADTGGFRGVTRKPLMKYYLGNVHPDSTEDDIKQYLDVNDVKCTHVTIFNTRRTDSLSALVVIWAEHAQYVESEDFWPDGVSCKQWRARQGRPFVDRRQ